MPEPREELAPAALEPENAASDAVETPGSTPSDDAGSTPAAATETDRELRNLKAQMGRQLKAEQLAREQAESQVAQMGNELAQVKQYVGQMGQAFTQQRQAQMQAYLASLPPDRRMAEELRILKTQVAAAQGSRQAPGPAQQRPPNDAEIAAYTQRQSQRILAEASTDLPDGVEISPDDEALDWTSEQTFRASAQALAKALARTAQGGRTVAKKAEEAKGTDDKLAEKVRQQVLSDIGASRPNSAKPIAKPGTPTAEDFVKAQGGYKSKGGFQGTLKRQMELRDQVRAGYGRS